jgi:DNA mismatch repair protein MutS
VHAELDTEIIGGRHPVLEADPDRRFVANDARFDPGRRVLLITGPNMGGKSTYMRAIAQIVLLAQIGSFVPAQSARIGYVDQIFSRVGAADALWRGQSTFMVEMEETADLVRRAGPRSLVVLDEIGRGTSTWDGMSIAQAVIEHLHDNVGARVLFATHFHELAELDRLAALANVHVEVRTWQGRVVFLYSVAEGPASHSYGVDVAALAGLPAPLVRRAEGLLAEREGAVPARRENHAGAQLTLFAGPEAAVVRRLRVLDVDRMTPLEALAILADLKAQLGDA